MQLGNRKPYILYIWPLIQPSGCAVFYFKNVFHVRKPFLCQLKYGCCRIFPTLGPTLQTLCAVFQCKSFVNSHSVPQSPNLLGVVCLAIPLLVPWEHALFHVNATFITAGLPSIGSKYNSDGKLVNLYVLYMILEYVPNLGNRVVMCGLSVCKSQQDASKNLF